MIKLKDLPVIMENYKMTVVIFFLISLCIFMFQNDQSGFDKEHHGFLSSHGASIAKNLSASHNFLMFEGAFIDRYGKISYQTYNRFPVTAFLILKIFMSIFSPNLSMEISVARQVMNLFFVGAMMFTFLSVYELSRSHLAAISITLFSFSSFYLNYYNDMIFNDTPTLFGFILSFHGIIIYHLYGRKPQMFLKAIVGLSLGWHVLSMLLAYILCSFVVDFLNNRSIIRLIRSDQFKLGLISLIFAIFLLGFNFVNEAIVTGKPLAEIGSFQSAKSRIGQNDTFQLRYNEYLEWGAFSKEQLHRIGAMSIPYVFKNSGNFKLVGGIVLLVVLFGCCLLKNRILFFTFLFSGFLWAFPMRGYTFSHDYQSIYYIGIPVIFFYIIVNSLKKKVVLILPFIMILSVVTFLQTNILFNQSKAAGSQKVSIITHDFQNIINYSKRGNVFYIDGKINEIAFGYHAVKYYLSGNFFTGKAQEAEYIISRDRNFNSSLLTPNNAEVFLFQGTPRFAEAFNKRGIDFYKKKNYDKAIQDFTRAIEKNSGFAEAYINRGVVYNKKGEYGRAISDYNMALEKKSNSVNAINSLAWLLSTCPEERFRNGEKAFELAEKGKDINPGAYTLDTLAAAYAENGNFEKAVEIQKEVIKLIGNQENLTLLDECKKHLKAYKARKAWREK